MFSDQFEKLSKEALKYTDDGLQLLVDANKLYQATISAPLDGQTRELLDALIDKQKLAIELIQNAMRIEKELMSRQKDAVEKLISKLA